MKAKLIIFVLLFAGFKCHASKPLEVSIVNLISNPEKYDKQFVRVLGVSKLSFESNGIWLSKEHLKYSIHKNALWMRLDFDRLDKTEEELAQYNGTYVLIEGVFNANSHGHMSLYSGAIEKISRFEPWEELKEKGSGKGSERGKGSGKVVSPRN